MGVPVFLRDQLSPDAPFFRDDRCEPGATKHPGGSCRDGQRHSQRGPADRIDLAILDASPGSTFPRNPGDPLWQDLANPAWPKSPGIQDVRRVHSGRDDPRAPSPHRDALRGLGALFLDDPAHPVGWLSQGDRLSPDGQGGWSLRALSRQVCWADPPAESLRLACRSRPWVSIQGSRYPVLQEFWFLRVLRVRGDRSNRAWSRRASLRSAGSHPELSHRDPPPARAGRACLFRA
jgi:hypothetical protein